MGKKSHEGYRDSRDGRFISPEQAQRRNPDNWQKERVPNPGYGDTDRGKKK